MVRLKPLTAWTQFPRMHIFPNDWEINSKSALHLKDDIPIIVDLVLIELFQTRKQMTFPPRLTVLTDVAQVRPSFCFVHFSFNFKNPFHSWTLPPEISLLFKADKSLILMLGCVISGVLIIAIYAADSLHHGLSLINHPL